MQRNLLRPMWSSDVTVITTVLRQFIMVPFVATKRQKEA